MLECLDKDEVSCFHEDFVAYSDEGVVKYLDNNNKDDFDVDFLLAHILKYFLEETLGW